MPIICFEGASAVGKTAVSVNLRENYSARVIPEVNFLFQRKPHEPKFWYYEKQIERWQMAASAAKNHEIVVLDGDPFQPIWYNWAYDYDFGDSFDEIMNFYRENVAARAIDFPAKYFVLTLENKVLTERKQNDHTRTRKNFARHLRFIEPQKAFFRFVKSIRSDLVEFIENSRVETTVRSVLASIENRTPSEDKVSSLDLFDAARDWLAKTDAKNFIF